MEGGEDGGRVGETEGWKEGEGRRDKGWREEGEKESGKRVARLIRHLVHWLHVVLLSNPFHH